MSTVRELMSSELVTVAPSEFVRTALDRMRESCVSALPVTTDEGELLGIITATDLAHRSGDEVEVMELMSSHMTTVPPDTDLHVAARLMRNHALHHLVVMEDNEPIGILATFDLLKVVEKHPRASEAGEPAESLEVETPEDRSGEQRDRLNELLAHLTRRNTGVERARHRGGEPLEADFEEQANVRMNDEVLDALSLEGGTQVNLIGRALQRLDAGMSDVCDLCGGTIATARLKALPYAVTCVNCARIGTPSPTT